MGCNGCIYENDCEGQCVEIEKQHFEDLAKLGAIKVDCEEFDCKVNECTEDCEICDRFCRCDSCEKHKECYF